MRLSTGRFRSICQNAAKNSRACGKLDFRININVITRHYPLSIRPSWSTLSSFYLQFASRHSSRPTRIEMRPRRPARFARAIVISCNFEWFSVVTRPGNGLPRERLRPNLCRPGQRCQARRSRIDDGSSPRARRSAAWADKGWYTGCLVIRACTALLFIKIESSKKVY